MNGFTTVGSFGFGIRKLPSTSVAFTVTVYTVHARNGPLWVIVRTVSWGDPDHENDWPSTSGVIVNTRLLCNIVSLNVITTGAFGWTSGSPSLGDVDTMYGLMHSDVKTHGLGLSPGTSGRFALSVALICTLYGLHWGKSS